MLPKKLKQNLSNYSEYKEQETLAMLLNLKVVNFTGNRNQDIGYLSQELEIILNCGLHDVINNSNINDLCSLISILCEAIEKNSCIQPKVFNCFIESAVEILSGEQLNLVMEAVCRYQTILVQFKKNDNNRLHRIINVALKKIHKSNKNSILRGNLHIFLSHLLNLGHRSGLNQHQPPKLQQQYTENLSLNEFKKYFQNTTLSLQFYQSYAYIYNKLLIKLDEQSLKQGKQNYQRKLFQNVSQFKSNLQTVILRFCSILPIKDNNLLLSLYPLPEILLKNCDTLQFRLLLLTKILLYIDELKQKTSKNPEIKKKSLVSLLELMKSIENICETSIQKLCSDQKFGDVTKVLTFFKENQKKWVEIKYGSLKNIAKMIKQPEKLEGLKNIGASLSVSQIQKSISQLGSAGFTQQPSTIIEHLASYKAQIKNKLSITTNKMQAFLSQQQFPILKKNKLSLTPILSQFSKNEDNLIINLAQNDQQSSVSKPQGIKLNTQCDNETQLNVLKWKVMRTLMGSKLSAISDPQFKKLFNSLEDLEQSQDKDKFSAETQVQ